MPRESLRGSEYEPVILWGLSSRLIYRYSFDVVDRGRYMNSIRWRIPALHLQTPAVIGFAACAWAILFAVAHIYWAVGGDIGLQGNEMSGLLLTVNIVAIPLCFLAAMIAIALTPSWGQITPHRIWFIGACGAAILLSIRGVIGILQGLILHSSDSLLLIGYDVWFLLGGILFSLVIVIHQKHKI